ncbi:MAG: hypothetical protein R3F17_10815 [Planctomycetota bacterium]
MQKRAKQLLGGAVALTLVAGVSAHVRLYYSGTGAELSWQNPSNVQVVIQAVGSEDVMGDSDANALRNAIDEWNLGQRQHRDPGRKHRSRVAGLHPTGRRITSTLDL